MLCTGCNILELVHSISGSDSDFKLMLSIVKCMLQVCYVCCLGSQLYFVESWLGLGIACMDCTWCHLKGMVTLGVGHACYTFYS